jgi:uncharacterized protein YbcI
MGDASAAFRLFLLREDRVSWPPAQAQGTLPVGASPAAHATSSTRRQRRCRAIITMKTQGEVEAAICEGMTRFEQEYMGRGPKDIRAHVIGDVVVVRLQGVLTAAEQHLVKTLPAEKGRDLLKQVRIQLIETARSVLEGMVHEVTGVKVLSLHHDISTATGEEIVVFTLAEAPPVRETKKR